MRYHTGVLIGRGGMAEVFKAWDPVREEEVALKILRHDDPELRLRLRREARLQGGIDHPGICKIFEIGETGDGRPYVAMERVEGRPLDEVAQGLTLEQTVALVANVADAVHAAHSAGLVHRDLKPSNILVKTTGESDLVPVVVDFGLARKVDTRGLTQTGIAVGTPGYMSPEQAAGDRRLDRRTDVFSLGVILYQLLADRLPFEGDSSLEWVAAVMRDDPLPLRKVAPAVPRQLAAITMTCLERDPERRYESGRTLAEDLRRWLRGEAIEARRPGPATWLIRRGRRHPVTAAALLLAATTLIGAGTSLTVQQQRSRERQIAAQRFGREAEQIRTMLRREHSLPLHDVRSVHREASDRLRSIKSGLDELPKAARGPALLTLGLGYLALDEAEQARMFLDQAWSRSDRNPDVAYARGLTLGELYRRKLDVARQIGSATARKKAIEDLQEQLRDPALAMLNAAQGSVESAPDFLAAQIAYFEGRLSDSIRYAEQAFSNHPWLYEALELSGRAAMDEGLQHQIAGEMATARARYDAAGKTLAKALEIGRSDPRVHQAECKRLQRVYVLDLMTDTPDAAVYQRAKENCLRGLRADRERADLWRTLAEIEWRRGEFLMNVGSAPEAALRAGIEAAENAVELAPEDAIALRHLATCWEILGEWQQRVDMDPRPALEQALAASRKALAFNPNLTDALSSLAGTLYVLGSYEERQGMDPLPRYREAIGLIERAAQIDPIYAWYLNLAFLHRKQAEVLTGQRRDPSAALDAAVKAASTATQKNGEFFGTWLELAKVHLARAEVAAAGSDDRRRSVGAGIDAVKAADAAKPGDVDVADTAARLRQLD